MKELIKKYFAVGVGLGLGLATSMFVLSFVLAILT